ncbi:MAG: glycerol dehydrogenase, partial [Anaerovoracaceae bacterium]
MLYHSLIAPTKYFQGRGLLREIYERTCHLGKKYAFLVDEVVYEITCETIRQAFKNKEGEYIYIFHGGESTLAEALRISTILKENQCDVIVGVGGGKVIDSAKLAAMQTEHVKTVIVPTSAASDAPCSANTVIYDENGTFLRAEKPKENPSVVLVDTEIIAHAPVRLLVAGMGDALATYYEARACRRAGLTNFSGGQCTLAGYAMAELCRDVLLEHGARAKSDVEQKQWSEDVECIAEANIYLSGVGFENNGVSVAHATYNGLTGVLKPFPVMHGEGVAFGLLVQLILEYTEAGQWNDEEWNQVVDFYRSVGLPTSFSQIQIPDPSDGLLEKIAASICRGANAHREPFEVTTEKITAALKKIRNMH